MIAVLRKSMVTWLWETVQAQRPDMGGAPQTNLEHSVLLRRYTENKKNVGGAGQDMLIL